MENIDTPQKAPKSIIIIFGAGGDLTKRKLIPALYQKSEVQALCV